MLIRFILTLIILYLLYRLVRGILRITGNRSNRIAERSVKEEDLVEDPVCHTYVPISEALKLTIEDRAVYFCTRECLEKYKEKQIGGN